jgi:hypothetical protein
VIDIEEYALRALEQDPPAARARFFKVAPNGFRERQDEIGNLVQVGEQFLPVDGGLSEACPKGVMMSAKPVE